MKLNLDPTCTRTITKDMIPEKLNTGMHHAADSLAYSINKQIDDVVIEGLKRNGFDFTDRPRQDVEEFIKKYCKCEDNIHHKERMYYVYNKPFLVHDYNIYMDVQWYHSDTQTTVIVDSGSFRFV